MNEDQILSEYIDGELPLDVSRKVALRLERDPRFRARFEALQQLNSRLHDSSGPLENAARLSEMQAQVWQRIQRKFDSTTPTPVSGFATLLESLTRRIALPLPALAAIVVVVLALGIVVLNRGPNTSQTAAVAGIGPVASGFPTGFSSQEPLSLPTTRATSVSTSDTSDIPALRMSRDGLSSANSLDNSTSPMEVTIEVQNLRQLLSLLENSKGINQLSIQLPRAQTLQPLGEPMLLRASEVNSTATTTTQYKEAGKP